MLSSRYLAPLGSDEMLLKPIEKSSTHMQGWHSICQTLMRLRMLCSTTQSMSRRPISSERGDLDSYTAREAALIKTISKIPVVPGFLFYPASFLSSPLFLTLTTFPGRKKGARSPLECQTPWTMGGKSFAWQAANKSTNFLLQQVGGGQNFSTIWNSISFLTWISFPWE